MCLPEFENAAQPPKETLIFLTQSLLQSISVNYMTIIRHSEIITLELGEATLQLNNNNNKKCLFDPKWAGGRATKQTSTPVIFKKVYN
jgi:hypothetical protein